MKRIHHFNTARDKLLHIETEGAIVNIRVGLQDSDGREVTSVEILPDSSEGWVTTGDINNRIYQPAGNQPR